MDSITSLPPPPPSPSRLNDEVESDGEPPLPPPPPEMFRSNLSLDSLPPPPAPGELPICNTPDLSGSSLSLASLPPPPPFPQQLVGETGTIRRAKPKPASSSSTPTNSLSPEGTPTHNQQQQQHQYATPVVIASNNNLHAVYATTVLNNGIASPQNCSPHSSYPGSNASTPTYAPSSPIGFVLGAQQQQMPPPPPFVPPPAYGSQIVVPAAVPQQLVQRQQSKLVEPIYGVGQPIQQLNGSSPVVSMVVNKPPGVDTVRRSALKQASSHYGSPPYLAELKASSSPQSQRRVTIQEPGMETVVPAKPNKKISFNLPPISTAPTTATTNCPAMMILQSDQLQADGISPALPLRKPMPPRRSDSTRLTSPKKLAASDQAPPGDFLKDLQRVMRKKWQVAQKCKLDSTTTPHEVLGFRDPPPAIADYRETNVSNWVQEHYGSDNLYENVYAVDPVAAAVAAAAAAAASASPSSRQQVPSVRFAEDCVDAAGRSVIASAIAAKRRPPPPPPKRAETTQLTTAARAMH